MSAKAWLLSGLAVGGCTVAVAHSPHTHNQPIFSGGTDVPHQQGGSDQGPSQSLGLPVSQMPPASASQSSTTTTPTTANTGQLTGFAACWAKYHAHKRSKPC